jgi:hypothetical protein
MTGPGPPTHSQVRLSRTGMVNGGWHCGAGGVVGTQDQPCGPYTHRCCAQAGNWRSSGARQIGETGKYAHSGGSAGTAGAAGDGTDVGLALGDGLAVGDGLADGPPLGAVANAVEAGSVSAAAAARASVQEMIFNGFSPRYLRWLSCHVRGGSHGWRAGAASKCAGVPAVTGTPARVTAGVGRKRCRYDN